MFTSVNSDLCFISDFTVKKCRLRAFTTKLTEKQVAYTSLGLTDGILKTFSIDFIKYTHSMLLLDQKTQEGIHFLLFSWLEKAKHFFLF